MKEWFEDLSTAQSSLVLGGGGARGCYEIGVWKALKEQKIQMKSAAGTSIGALVGAMYVQQDIDPLIRFVENLKPVHIAADLFDFPETFAQALAERKEITGYLANTLKEGQGMDISPLKEAIAGMFDYARFAASPINFACMTFNVTARRPVAFFKKEMNASNAADVILASASCFPAFPMLEMNGDQYIDGGYWDNLPVDLAIKMGAEKILAINVEGPGIIRPVLKKTDLIEVKPILPLGNFLDFSSRSAMRSLQAGYLETRKLMGIDRGFLYTFYSGFENLAFFEGYLDFMLMIDQVPLRKEYGLALLRHLVRFHSSDLSKELSAGHQSLMLLEGLAWILGIDAWKAWNFDEFAKTVLKVARSVRAEPGQESESAQEEVQRFARFGAPMRTAAIYALQKKGPAEKQKLDLLARVYPYDCLMALAWKALEGMYGAE